MFALFKTNVFVPFCFCLPAELFSISINIPDNSVLSVTLLLASGCILFTLLALFYFSKNRYWAAVAIAVAAVLDFVAVAAWEIVVDDFLFLVLKLISSICVLFVALLWMLCQIRLQQ